MPEREPLCASNTLQERGRAWVWAVQQKEGRPMRAFALRFDGRVRAYLNRCVHLPAEMDWLPGEFFDVGRRWIVCAMHGALYEPADGRCVGGPCRGGRLTAIDVVEEDGQVYWYPSRDIRLLASDPAAAESAP
jgi:nitrite reductase/ring-hydroxylating ferredoxin subunit